MYSSMLVPVVPAILGYGLLATNFLVWNRLHCEKGRLVSTKFKTYLYLKNLGTTGTTWFPQYIQQLTT